VAALVKMLLAKGKAEMVAEFSCSDLLLVNLQLLSYLLLRSTMFNLSRRVSAQTVQYAASVPRSYVACASR
jgi:hypothetical protein